MAHSAAPRQNLTPSTLNLTRGEASGLVSSAGRPADVVAFEDAVVTYLVESAEMLGVPKSVAAIYGICFASPEPLSFSEINERLDISAGSISQGLRVLREVGALKIAQAGCEQKATKTTKEAKAPSVQTNTLGRQHAGASSRASEARSCYTPNLELRNLVLHWIETRLQAQLKSGQDRMQAIAAAVPAGAPGEALRERVHSLQNWQNKARALLPVMKTFLKLG